MPLQVTADASGSSDADGTIASYAFDFGDGTTTTGAATSSQHTYTTAGDFTLRVTVTDDDGASALTTRIVAVNAPPQAAATATPTSGSPPLTVDFDASGSTDADGTIASVAWDFGDGTQDTGTRVSHTYTTVGAFTVTYTVTDDDGASADGTLEISTAAFAISGTVRIQTSSAIDSDTNDVFSTQIDNDSLATAQLVPNPATVGGYVTAPGAGIAGAVSTSGDEFDVFRFSALGGETIILSIGDPGQDLDLRLYDAGGNEIANSLGITSTEVIGPIPSAGDYSVQVETFLNAASTYVLNIGRTQTLGVTPSSWSTFAEFVPGEMVLGERTGTRASATSAAAAIKRTGGDAGSAGLAAVPDGYRSRFRPSAGVRPLSADHAARERTLSAIKETYAAGERRYVEPNWIRRPFLTPNDQFFPNQWHYASIKLPQAWDITVGDPSVIVAVIDTGVLLDHPEFQGQLVPGFDFISDVASAADGDGIDADPDDPGDGGLGGSSSFHGTHVAGTVAARTDNGDPVDGGGGVAGTAWLARIMPLRVLGVGGGSSFDVREAMKFAGGLPNVSGTTPAEPADIINLSLGGGGFSQADQDVVDQLRAAGVIVIAAAGNEATSTPSFPAAYEGVVSVAATTITDAPANYSNFGSTIDVAAPGGDTATDVNGDGIADGVISAIGDDSDGNSATPPIPRLGVLAGTSMAAPHVAGVAALMRAVDPDLTPAEFDLLLASGAITEDLGEAGRDDRYGHGLINAQKAVVLARDGGTEAGILVATPGTLNFGAFSDSLDFRLANAGNQAISVTGITSDVPWLTAPSVLAGDGLGVYTATVDRGLLPGDGIFQGELTITSTANTTRVPVVIQQSSADLSADAGTTFIILTAPGGGANVVPFEVAEATGGLYTFSFENVPQGEYELVAGSDSDNDGFLCDGGESCGIFPTFDAPTTIVLDGDRTGLDFVTSFRTSISIAPESEDAVREEEAPRYRIERSPEEE